MDSTDDIAVAPVHRYWAFISYSQRDAKWAQWLHGSLERYRIPRSLVGRGTGSDKIPPRLFPIFRDRDELASAADLGHAIEEALRASRALIVVCSPHAAASRWVNEEVRTFKALGHGDRIFPLIVAGESFASSSPERAASECFPPALRFHTAPDGTLTDQRAEPLAADVRPGKDGRANGLLKLVAGILGIRFDELRRREFERARRQRVRRAAATLAALALLFLGYAGLADDDLRVPGGERLREYIDRCGCSAFRRIPSPAEIEQAVVASRAALRHLLIMAVTQGQVRQGPRASSWEVAQIAAAIYQDRDAQPDELKRVTQMIDRAFASDMLLVSNGKHLGWNDDDVERVEPVLWMLIALSTALGRDDVIDAPGRERFLGYLRITQEVAENFYYPNGGWKAHMEDLPGHESVYAAALALHALLQVRANHQCWRDSCPALERLIAAVSNWLIAAFVDDNGATGWRRFTGDELSPVSNLGILAYGALARAHRDAGVAVPDQIRAAELRLLTGLRQRPYLPAHEELADETYFYDKNGQRQQRIFIRRMLWYPWSVAALRASITSSRDDAFNPTDLALRRSLGHIVVTLSADLRTDMATALPWVRAETAYGLGQVP